MEFFARARRYGEAVATIDEYLGSAVRERVMEEFSRIAGPLQQRGMKDPWEMIARSAKLAGIDRKTIQALFVAYLLRIQEFDRLPRLESLDPEVLTQLRTWGVLGRIPGAPR